MLSQLIKIAMMLICQNRDAFIFSRLAYLNADVMACSHKTFFGQGCCSFLFYKNFLWAFHLVLAFCSNFYNPAVFQNLTVIKWTVIKWMQLKVLLYFACAYSDCRWVKYVQVQRSTTLCQHNKNHLLFANNYRKTVHCFYSTCGITPHDVIRFPQSKKWYEVIISSLLTHSMLHT